MFTHVVHLSTDAVRATYGNTNEPSMVRVLDLISNGRLVSLGTWLSKLAAGT